MNLRQKLIESGLFKETQSRDLVADTQAYRYGPSDEQIEVCYRVVLSFDAFGELTEVDAFEFDKGAAAIVAANRKALGLPPQHSAES